MAHVHVGNRGLIIFCALGLSACNDLDAIAPIPVTDAGVEDAGFPDLGFEEDAGFPDLGTPDAGFPEPATEPVYIHTADRLYSFDPADGRARSIGIFRTAEGPIEAGIVDIAIDLNGRMYGGDREGEGASGSGWNNIYVIDPETALCRKLFEFDDQLNGLTILSDGRLVVAGREISIIDPDTLEVQQVMSSEYETSGDIVGLPDGNLYWTVRGSAQGEGDGVVRINPRTGAFTYIGQASVDRIYGLGFAEGALYGFSSNGVVVKIDPQSGSVLEQQPLDGAWWGATTNPVLWE